MAFLASPRLSVLRRLAFAGIVAAVAGVAMASAARSEALLLIEADTGKVLQSENATYPWYPASLTKLMTAYVTLYNVKQGRITLDTLLTVSPNAVAQAPSKMGLKAGTQVTVDNALKMMMVKSANDMAMVLAEGVGGSIDGFSAQMNAHALRLGMTQTSYVNPNGLPDDRQITSARDLGILARSIIRDLPEYEYFVHIPAIKFGRRITPNFNKLIGRYPGADGMKTGFICASGFNLVASATRGNKRLIAVVLGAPSSAQRAVKAAQLLERGFHGNKLAWLKPSLGLVNMLQPIDAAPPNLRDDVCGPKRKRPAAEDEDDDLEVSADASGGGVAAYAAGLQPPTMKASELMATAAAPATPVIVYTGPTRTGADILAADAAESAKQDAARPVGKKKKGAARTKLATDKSDAADKTDSKGDSKADAKADSKPGAKPAANSAKPVAAKPLAAAAKPVSAPAKPAAAKPASAKPAATPASNAAKPKPAAKDTSKSTAKPASDQKS